jgi:predicted metal-dependent hydrolase
MSISSSLIIVGNMEVLVVRKSVKNLHLTVLPPSGRVRVTAPLETKDDQVRVFLTTKLRWIQKQQQQFQAQLRQVQRHYISGETHYYLGKPYRLRVDQVINNFGIKFRGKDTIIMQVGTETTIQEKEQLMNEWYRKELKSLLEQLIPKWYKKFRILPKYWRIQKMKTRWGTCNPESGRILLNLELIKKPVECIEYVLVHEWLHLIEPEHNDHFLRLLKKCFPRWRHAKDELNRFILSHEQWK